MTLPYRDAHSGRSLAQLATSIVPFCGLWALMWVGLQYSYLLTLALAVPAAGFLVRLFILQHDCGHGSFFKSKRANDALGRLLSVLTFTPYDRWRKNHAIHHATSGDLDRRGCGDVLMLTVREYRASPHSSGGSTGSTGIRSSCSELGRSSISSSFSGSRSTTRE